MTVDFVDQIWWYASRAAGIVAWVLLSASIIAGLATSGRVRKLPPGWMLDLHRFLSMLALVFIGVHVVALVPDDFVHFGLVELLVPFASEWRPGAVAWGVVALWLVVAVQVSSLLRGRIPTRWWRAVHMLSYLVWSFSTIHLLTAGTDAAVPAFRIVQAVGIGAVLLSSYRLAAFRPGGGDSRGGGRRRRASWRLHR